MKRSPFDLLSNNVVRAIQKVTTSSDAVINDAITFLIIHFGLMEEEVTGAKKYHVVMYFK